MVGSQPPRGLGTRWRSLLRLHAEAGLVVALADGAGNSRGGASAAEALIRAVVSAAPSFRSALNEWDLQDLLFGVDETLALGGEETTGVIAVFGQGEIIAAAAGDTVLIVGMEDGGLVRFPEPRTDCRLGSGRADVRVLRILLQTGLCDRIRGDQSDRARGGQTDRGEAAKLTTVGAAKLIALGAAKVIAS